MKTVIAFAIFLCWATKLLVVLASPVPSDQNANALSFKIIEPSLFEIESFVDPAELPPVDTSVFENDIDESFEEEKRRQSNINSGIVGNQYRWGTNIDFQISSAYSQADRQIIESALQTLAGVLANCRVIRLWSGTPSGDHIFITKAESGCFSAVGRRGGRQNLNLKSPGCVSRGTAVHEMIHAVGFHHEQVRPDRDNRINIYWGNIQRGREHNFQTNPAYSLTYGVPYDYYSIMHYGETAFTANGQRTIQAKQSGIVVGSRGVVTESDRRKVRAMYNCS